jgi:glycosyltransferase involved in cell wall biosynthesis
VIAADKAVPGSFRVILVTGGEPCNAGLAVSIGKLASILVAIGASVRVVTYCEVGRIGGLEPELLTELPYGSSGVSRFALGQVDAAQAIRRLHRREPVDVVVFAFGRDLAIIPVVVGRLLARRVVLRSDGRPSLVVRRYISGPQRLRRLGFRAIEEVVYRLVDLLITENRFMIDDNEFSGYRMVDAGPLCLDLGRFAPTIPASERPYDLCYVGTLADEKGVLDLINALPPLRQAHPGLRTLICGDGPCRESVESTLDAARLSDAVTMTGWIDHEDVARYLNQSRMLVLPSRREGLPNIVLEAMACGTLVLARPIGGIPGVLVDGQTGYHILSPGAEGVRETVERAMVSDTGEACVVSAHALIESEFSREAVVARYRQLFQSLGIPGEASR